jgi:hypothetical protein
VKCCLFAVVCVNVYCRASSHDCRSRMCDGLPDLIPCVTACPCLLHYMPFRDAGCSYHCVVAMYVCV